METGHILAGRYKVIERIGSGGMSTVYRAHEIGLEREVAIKVLISALTDDPQLVERFNREARIIAGLQHPNIIPIHFYGIEDFGSFLVMPLLKGGSLDQRMEQLDFYPSISEIGELAEKLGGALQYAHRQDVVHRDIKFSNIMFDNVGSPYLVDFGIAKMLGVTNITSTGMTVGTPQFMPPEQWRNENITAAVDQYAFAILLYTLLAHTMPFSSPTPHGLMYEHLELEAPFIKQYRDDVPDGIAEALDKALSKAPEKRYPSIQAFINDFVEACRSVPRETTGFFSRSLAQKPAQAQAATLPRMLPNTPTEMVASVSPTESLDETRIALDSQELVSAKKSNHSRLMGAVVVAIIFVGSITGFFVFNQQTQSNATSTVVAQNAAASDTATASDTPTETDTASATVTASDTPTETDTPSPTATDTASATVTNTALPTANQTGTVLALLATDIENEKETEVAIERETSTALAGIATERAQKDETATVQAVIEQATEEANRQAVSETAIALTDAASAANRNATRTAIAAFSTEQAHEFSTVSAIQTIEAGRNGTLAAIQSLDATATHRAGQSTATAAGELIVYGEAIRERRDSVRQAIWSFRGSSNDVITISLRSGDFDPQLELFFNNRQMAVDNNSGYGDDARIDELQLTQSGIYTIVVAETDGKNFSGTYTLGITEMIHCPSTQASRLLVGEWARVTLGGGKNRLRVGPSTTDPIARQIPEGGNFEVVGGPVCDDGFAWYQVIYEGTIGWTAEGDAEEYWTELLPENEPILLTGAYGLTTGIALGAGEMQVEYYCVRRGLSATTNGIDWFCTNSDGQHVETFNQSTFDLICRDTYQESDAFAQQGGEGTEPAYRWRCYQYPE